MRRILLGVFGAGLAMSLAAASAPAARDAQEYGLYAGLVRGFDGTVDEATDRVVEAVRAGGWEVLAVHATGTPDGCAFEARVVVIHSDGYAATVRAYGSHTAFGVPLRVAIFEDEGGVHVAALNLQSLNRTVVDEQVPGTAWLPWQDRLGSAVKGAFPEHASPWEYGQVRDEGRISRTFGIMAGGPFVEKIEVAASFPAAGTTVSEVAARLHDGFGVVESAGEWDLQPVYLVDLPDMESAVVGVSGAPMEAQAFAIVGNGGDPDREDLSCPGLDHAAAFPVELVVTRVEDRIEVHLVDEMFRMKMFFEDAGKVAFAKNMGMPGSIEDEIRRRVEAALGS